MTERYIKIEGNQVYDTKTNRIIHTPLIIIDTSSYLIIDILDDYITRFFNKDIFTDYGYTSNHTTFLRYEMNDEDADLIINNLNAYDFFMSTEDFDSVQHYIKKALEIE